MAEQRFVDFTFPSTASTTRRTMPDRLCDVYNVKDFGAKGDGTTPDDVAINAAVQAAINASSRQDATGTFQTNGGIIFFPPGVYAIANRILVPGSPACALSFIGSGDTGSLLRATSGSALATDYILYVGHGSGTPVKSIRDLGFENNAHASRASGGSPPTSTEPPNGWGCVYIGSGNGVQVLRCGMGTMNGINLFSAAMNTLVELGYYQGAWNENPEPNTPPNSKDLDPNGAYSYGVILTHGKVGSVFWASLGHGIVCVGNPAVPLSGICSLEVCHMEVSGFGFRLGSIPISWWDATSGSVHASGDWPVKSASLVQCGYESCGLIGLRGDNVKNLNIENWHSENLSNQTTAVVQLKNVSDSMFRHFLSSNGGGINLAPSGATTGVTNCRFDNCVTGTAGWVLYNSFAAGDMPNIFSRSNTDGGLTLAQLPPSPARITDPVVCTNSQDPSWNSGAGTSNVGKPIVGGGTNRVLAAWNGAAWVIAG